MNTGSEPDGPAFLDIASRATLATAVSSTRFDRIHWVEATGSTNADLAELVRSGAPEQVLVADLQTAGRGRRDRAWTAPSQSAVLMSFLLRSPRKPGDLETGPFWLVGAVALAAAEVISDLTSTPCRLKWPNDLLLGSRKVAGVLAQAVDGAVVVGIGINANWFGSRPPGVPKQATAVDEHASAPIDRVEFVAAVAVRVDALLSLEHDDLRSRWMQQCETLGTQVRVEMGNESTLIGKAVDISSDGALIVDGDDERVTIHVGDVVHLRPG